jgi:hypothetical protein
LRLPVGTFALPAEVTAVLGSEDMSDVTPRSNGRRTGKPKPQTYIADSVVIVADAISGERLIAVVIEPQGQASDDKDQSWPVYATTARKANKCPRAVLVVACWDTAEADACRRIIATGHPGLVFVPIVIDRDTAPPLADASPYLVLFNTVIGASTWTPREAAPASSRPSPPPARKALASVACATLFWA